MLHRIVHNDPTCRVCRSTTPGMVATAAPIPPPFPNPEHKRPTYRAPNGERDGGPTGTHWYHGTGFDPHYDAEDDHQDDPTYGGELAKPEGSGSEYGERAEHHWNTDLGVHFTSLKHVASEFAEKKGEEGHQRIAHATLHMANPIHFDDEEDFALHAAKWAHGAGHRFLPKHPQAHQAFIHGHYTPEDDDDTGSVEHYDEEEGKGRGYEYLHEKGQFEDNDGPREARRRLADIDVSGPKLSHGPKALERWIGLHPDREQITQGYSNHLRDAGHDGVTYGNSYEGPYKHKCAIALDHTPVNIHHWEWLNEDHPGNKAREHQEPQHNDPNQLEFNYHARLAAQRRRNGWKLASEGWEFNHYDISDGKGKSFRLAGKPPGDGAPAFLEYRKPQEGKIDFQSNGFNLDYVHRKHGPEVAGRMRQEALDHHNATEYNPDADTAPPEKAKPRIYYHGTTVPDVTHILPANRHSGGVMFPHVTSAEHAYATRSKSAAWDYAEKAWNVTGGQPRVYQVRPMHGDHSHVEQDPSHDEYGQSRGNNEADHRSRVGWEVVRELKTPKHYEGFGDDE
jgi:hypothetical protein